MGDSGLSAIIQTIVSWITAIISWVARIFEWLGGLFKDFMEFFIDLPLQIWKGFLDGVIYVLSAIPVPDFLGQYSLGAMFAQLPSSLLFFVGAFNLHGVCLALAAGVTFRLLRKAITLGQW